MVTETLTDDMIDAGGELTSLLDDSSIQVRASFWSYQPETESWRLVIVTSEAETRGPKAVYREVQTKIADLRERYPNLELSDVRVMPPGSPLVGLLRRAVRTGRGVSRTRLTGNAINGHFIDDVLIYRMT